MNFSTGNIINMPLQEVTIIDSPITTRYVQPGSTGHIDLETNKIRVGGVWFDYDLRWKINPVLQ